MDGIDDLEGSDTPSQGGAPDGSSVPPSAPPPSASPEDGGSGTPDPGTEPQKPSHGLGDDLDPILGSKQKASAGPKELRSAYEKTTKELAETKSRLADFEKTISNAKQEAAKAVQDELKSLQSKLDEYEQKIQLVDFRSSKAFKEQFHVPATKAWEAAGAALRGVKVENPDGSERPIEAKEIAELAAMEPADAWAAAQRFGVNAPLVHQHVQAIRDREMAKQQALSEWGEKGKQHQQQREQERLAAQQDWEKGTEEILSARAADLGIENPDDATKALLDHGSKLARLAFLGGGDATPEQIITAQKLAAVRVRTFGAVLSRAQRAESRVSELEAKLAQYEAGDPPVGGSGGGSWAPPGSSGGAEDGIDAIDGFDQPH